MRFAITGCDRYIRVFEEFLRADWEPVKLFTSPATNLLSSNTRMTTMAARRGIPVQETRMSEDDLRDLRERNCEVLVVASYDWRIGNWPAYLQYAINFHPSPLPLGRGPYPLVRAILEDRRSWAITCHKIAAEFDSGDILATETFDLHAQECHESLNLKLQMASGRLARQVVTNFSTLWDTAVPQSGGEYWPLFTPTDRTLNFFMPVETILRQLRAFGSLECYAMANGEPVYVRRAIGWTEAHQVNPHTVMHVDNHTIVISAKDGYIALLDWGLLPAPEQSEDQNPPAN
jgi:methionyl-tRNA formyltransferase